MTIGIMMKRVRRLAAILGLGLVFFAGPTVAQATINIEVLVNNALYNGGQINTSLNQYLSDLQLQGYTPHLTTSTFANPAALRTYLGNRYSNAGIQGAVMIGDFPAEHFERNGQFDDPNDYQRFASDLYYMDVNGAWSDSTNNGTYDTHTGNTTPEIWVSHMITSNLTSLGSGRTQASLLNSYFTKNHQYRQQLLSTSRNALAYVDDDWIPWANQWGGQLAASVTGTTTIVSNANTTNTMDYLSRVSPLVAGSAVSYESLLLCAHSWAQGHSFTINSGTGTDGMLNYDVSFFDPQVLFYNLFCCSNADFESTGYMGGEYVFGTTKGLFSVGSTKTGSMLEFDDYYNPLAQGATFGEAYLDWWQAVGADGYSASEMDWHYGMTITGDPLLRTQAFSMVPEPSSLVLLAIAGLFAFRSVRRRLA